MFDSISIRFDILIYFVGNCCSVYCEVTAHQVFWGESIKMLDSGVTIAGPYVLSMLHTILSMLCTGTPERGLVLVGMCSFIVFNKI